MYMLVPSVLNVYPVGTTKPTIQAIRERTHWNMTNIKPQHPVTLGLTTLEELEAMVRRANKGKKVEIEPAPASYDEAEAEETPAD